LSAACGICVGLRNVIELYYIVCTHVKSYSRYRHYNIAMVIVIVILVYSIVLAVVVRKLKTTLGGFWGKKSFWANITRRTRRMCVFVQVCRARVYVCGVHVHTSFPSLYATPSTPMAVTTSLNVSSVSN